MKGFLRVLMSCRMWQSGSQITRSRFHGGIDVIRAFNRRIRALIRELYLDRGERFFTIWGFKSARVKLGTVSRGALKKKNGRHRNMCTSHSSPARIATKHVYCPTIGDEKLKSHLMLRAIFSVGPLFILPVVAVLIKAQSGSQRDSDAC